MQWIRLVTSSYTGKMARAVRCEQAIPAKRDMAGRLALHPNHPERVCWGCDKYCSASDLRCGNGSDRAQHPIEIFGSDWVEQGLDALGIADSPDPAACLTAPRATASPVTEITGHRIPR